MSVCVCVCVVVGHSIVVYYQVCVIQYGDVWLVCGVCSVYGCFAFKLGFIQVLVMDRG